MGLKDIIVHVDSTSESDTRLAVAIALAIRFKARLTGLHVIPDPEVPPYFKASVVGRIIRMFKANADRAAKTAVLRFNRATRNRPIATECRCVEGDLRQLLAEHARFADLLIVGQSDTENISALRAFLPPQDIVISAGTPILVVPNLLVSRDVGQHILLAWDGSREAARAIRDAMPFLQSADKVSLVAIDPGHQGHLQIEALVPRMVEHLARHNVVVAATEAPADGRTMADFLLSHASAVGADLLVMGAFGHPRVMEFFAGGASYDLPYRTTIPILMSH